MNENNVTIKTFQIILSKVSMQVEQVLYYTFTFILIVFIFSNVYI